MPGALLSVCLSAIVAGGLATAHRVTRARPGRPTRRAAAIVVFGAGVRDGEPCGELRARIEHAADLFAEGWAPRVVCSGGPGEPAAMARALGGRVPAAALDLDPGGVSTRATLATARSYGRVALVSSPYHAARIAAEARRQRVEAEVCAAPRCPVEAAPAARRRQVLREVVAIWWYSVRRPRL